MKKTIMLVPVLFVFIAIFMTCDNKTNNHKDVKHSKETKEEMKKETAKKDCDQVHWSHHKGEHGPENWANLCEGFKDCNGEKQSPIDIKEAVKGEDLKPLEFEYGKTKVNIINNGHTVQFNIDKGSSMMVDGKKYDLLQFHYHATSEHTIKGEYSPLEVHFVHRHADDDFAVLGIMYEEGEANDLFNKYLKHFPADKGEYTSDEKFDLDALLPDNLSYYHYGGSLTTPPCSEVVSWYLLQNPLRASQEQIKDFSEILDKNFRPIQELNGRTIYKFGE
ncbi:Carbonic anhydrase precursor [Salinivirga cyanobacteriivorans]|uniref:carbonic anhydrase n=1 Tax=Salinivirga cyanobacteriivorans TaxID=1307839 RepID=A0A0S2HX11_9BACT|nr:carbonic anhydrase family protein [Salinivirga cyanobacteriivorans]ALO14500.1 Carbonic anhydrase precursor [Salinivirga cyanobacteriivorans]